MAEEKDIKDVDQSQKGNIGSDQRGTKEFTLGGPYSAFTGILRHPSHVPTGVGDSHWLKLDLYDQLTPPDLRIGRRDFTPGSHIAPAFAQIFQRRRRRENRPRRQRTTFTSDQTLKLELEYNRADYITRPRRFELAETLNLTESQIKIWFQNRRAKDKRIEKAHMDHHLRNMGYSGVPLVHTTSSSMCGACSVPLPLPLNLGPAPWNPLTS
ncbi:hypothetical protein ACF0H5_012070 [Mactra antiquata]